MKIIAIIALTAAVTGCSHLAGTTAAVIKADQEKIEFTRADAARAQALAVAAGDAVAVECWAAVVAHLPDRPADLDLDAIGALSKFQQARNLRRLNDAGVSDETRAKCAVMILDAQKTISGLAATLSIGVP